MHAAACINIARTCISQGGLEQQKEGSLNSFFTKKPDAGSLPLASASHFAYSVLTSAQSR